ncbi:uncharacterized protein LOC117118052 [Anneissia japonica]|uniref:uncharacterized protein LOC117118052 n=1 Tax=Anneissia japonica TaxID=1529436 RepID=UPI001425AE51|nr:uncharacterized protein LOC117118052 [Anneissia japonica]
MDLNLPDNASISDIYVAAMTINIQESLVEIPLCYLEKLHEKILEELKLVKPASMEDLHKISFFFKIAKDENKKYGKKNLTFKSQDFNRGRHSRFSNNPKTTEKVTVHGYDVTSTCFRNAVGNFRNDFCRSMGGYWSKLADKCVPSSISFEYLVSKDILTKHNIEVTSYETLNIDAGSYCYAYPAKTTLYFHAPESVKNECIYFEFLKQQFRYGENKCIDLTMIKVSSESRFVARARAEYDIKVRKGYCIKGWAKVISFGINAVLDQEKEMSFSSDQLMVNFKCGPDSWFKIKQKPDIKIKIKEANDFLSLEMNMRHYQEKLKMTGENGKLEDYKKKAIEEAFEIMENEHDDDEEQELIKSTLQKCNACVSDVSALISEKEKRESDTWLLAVIANGFRKEYNVKLSPCFEDLVIKKLVLEIDTRADAFSHMDTALKKTGIMKHEFVLNPPTANQMSDINNLCGHAYEEIVNAKVLATAAEHGIPLKCVEGDGIGHYINSAGKQVASPKYVDAIFTNASTGDSLSVQYKFCHEQAGLENLYNNWKMKWQNEDLSNIDVVVPKGVNQDGNFKDVVNFKNEITVETPTHQDVRKWIDSNRTKLTRVAEEHIKYRVDIKNKIKRSNTAMKKLKDRIESLKTKGDACSHPEGKKRISENIEKMKKDFKDHEQRILKLNKEMQKINENVDKIVKKDGLNPIPGMDDEMMKQQNAKLEKFKLEELKKKANRIMEAKKQLKATVALACIISTSTELICSLVDELALCDEGKQTFGEAALNILKRTSKAAGISTGIAAGIGGIQYGLTRLALSESSRLSTFGSYGSRIFGPALMVAGVTYQSYNIIAQYNKDKEMSPAFARKRMGIDFARMAGVTVGSVGSFALATACISSTPVGLAVGAICCIVIGIGDYFLGKYLNLEEESAKLEYLELRKEVIDKAYGLFDLECHCTDKELKTAYHAAILKYHPDKAENKEEATDIARAIITAYTLLKTVRSE